MIIIKTPAEQELMKVAGRITKNALILGGKMVKPGVTTAEIDASIEHFIRSRDAIPSFLGYGGFPGSACISVNEEVIHGIPGNRKILDGDIVKIDVGAIYGGFHGDCAATFAAGTVPAEVLALIENTRQCFYEGLKFAREGYRVSDISHAIQVHAEDAGFTVVRAYVGHGVGRDLHESPEVPNFGLPGRGSRLREGMTIAIEPMINLGEKDVHVLSDRWTVVTDDGQYSAHYENTVLITGGDPVILTKGDEDI
jgi:methionyl aminopeptidase